MKNHVSFPDNRIFLLRYAILYYPILSKQRWFSLGVSAPAAGVVASARLR